MSPKPSARALPSVVAQSREPCDWSDPGGGVAAASLTTSRWGR